MSGGSAGVMPVPAADAAVAREVLRPLAIRPDGLREPGRLREVLHRGPGDARACAYDRGRPRERGDGVESTVQGPDAGEAVPGHRRRGWRRGAAAVLAALVGLALVAAAVLVWWPSVGFSRWLSTRTLVAHALSFPVPAGVALGLAGLVLLAVGVWAWRRRHRAWWWWLAASVPGLAAALGLVLAPAGPPWAAPAPDTGSASADGTTLTVVTFNSLGAFTAADLTALETRFHPDVVVLPETSHARAQRAMRAAGWRGTLHTSDASGRWAPEDSGIEATSVLLREGLPEYTPRSVTPSMQGSVRLEPTDPAHPLLLAVHPAAPVPGWMDEWRRDLDGLVTEAETAAEEGPVLLVGDLNATVRHGGLAGMEGLADTARRCGTPQGTWPVGWPAWGRSAIDHVIVSHTATVDSCEVLELGVSDHLAYATTVHLPPA